MPDDDADADEEGRFERPAGGMLRLVFGAESLAVTGLILALLPLVAQAALIRLAAVLAGVKPADPRSSEPQRAETFVAEYGAVTAGTALLGVIAGLLALRLSAAEGRGWVRGVGGGAVLMGVLLAAAHAVAAAGGFGGSNLFLY